MIYIVYVVFVIIIVALVLLVFLNRQGQGQKNIAFSKDALVLYYRISDTLDYSAPSIPAIQPFLEQSSDHFKVTDSFQAANFIMFETLNSIDILLQDIKLSSNTRFIYGLRGTDMMASKSMLAITLKRNGYSYLLPNTYIMEGGADSERFSREFNNGIYILKKNVQRQEGFLISDNKQEILDAFKNSDHVVCQELLQDPLVVGGRKVNIRVYLLVVVKPDGTTNMYMYDDGFMYYTAEMWRPRTTETGPNITTGYIDRQVYQENPLTTKDLIAHLGASQGKVLQDNMLATMGKLASVYAPMFKSSNINYPGTKFLIYGCDVAPSSSLDVLIMEVNKGPDLGYKDDRDKQLKLGMVKDMLQIVGIGIGIGILAKSSFVKLI